MEFKPFKEIEAELMGLTRTQQYKILLLIKEWRDFREEVFSKDNHIFKNCFKPQGPSYEDIPEHEWEEECNKVVKINRVRDNKTKEIIEKLKDLNISIEEMVQLALSVEGQESIPERKRYLRSTTKSVSTCTTVR